MSFPSILSSTLPLAHGGYDDGLLHRPTTLAEAMRTRGFHTVALSSSPWLDRTVGYDRGFDDFQELFDVDKFWKMFSTVYHPYYAKLLAAGAIAEDDFSGRIASVFGRYLDALQRLCIDKSGEVAASTLPYHAVLHRHPFNIFIRALEEMALQFRSDPKAFVRENLRGRVPKDLKEFLTGVPERGAIRSVCVKLLDRTLKLCWLQLFRYEYSVPGAYLAGQIIDAVRNNRSRGLFLWTHFLDIHDGTYISGRIGFPPAFVRQGLQMATHRDVGMSAKTAYCLRYVDDQVAKIVQVLEADGLLDSTLIVICGDHGSAVGCQESTAGSVFDKALRVPLIFYNPNIGAQTVTEPTSLLDVAPTIIDLLAGEPVPEFSGDSVLGGLAADRVTISESLGAGPGDFDVKAIKMAVVKGGHKLIWREPGYETTCAPGVNYLFDLKVDPAETSNLYDNQQMRPVTDDLERIASERSQCLRGVRHDSNCSQPVL